MQHPAGDGERSQPTCRLAKEFRPLRACSTPTVDSDTQRIPTGTQSFAMGMDWKRVGRTSLIIRLWLPFGGWLGDFQPQPRCAVEWTSDLKVEVELANGCVLANGYASGCGTDKWTGEHVY